jgi:hyperosmotically inducible periplasmic protein
MKIYLAPILALLLATGCTAANPLNFAVEAVETAVEDRSGGDIKTDLRIKTAFLGDVLGEMPKDVIAISADVYEQNVMLTGTVDSAAHRQEAERLVTQIKGVKNIYNEILVIPSDVKKKKGAVQNFVDDTLIETKIQGLFLEHAGINVTNFRWRAVGGHVYLFGRALTQRELNDAAGIVADIKDVTGITQHVVLRP